MDESQNMPAMGAELMQILNSGKVEGVIFTDRTNMIVNPPTTKLLGELLNSEPQIMATKVTAVKQGKTTKILDDLGGGAGNHVKVGSIKPVLPQSSIHSAG
jgi:hypothetical protein